MDNDELGVRIDFTDLKKTLNEIFEKHNKRIEEDLLDSVQLLKKNNVISEEEEQDLINRVKSTTPTLFL
jgi:hypothetical protein